MYELQTGAPTDAVQQLDRQSVYRVQTKIEEKTELKYMEDKFTRTVCDHCGQTTDYLMNMDKGSALIVAAVAAAAKRLGRNRVHLADETGCMWASDHGGYDAMVRSGHLTFRMIANATKPCNFGLMSGAEGTGEYSLTAKGARFLLGEPIMRSIVIDKATHSKKADWPSYGMVTIQDLMRPSEIFWNVEDIRVIQ